MLSKLETLDWNVVFLDETTFSSFVKRNYGYSKASTQCYSKFKQFKGRIGVLMSIDLEGIISVQFTKKAFNANQYALHMQKVF